MKNIQIHHYLDWDKHFYVFYTMSSKFSSHEMKT